MPTTEHTDRRALEDLYNWPPHVARPSSSAPWYRLLFRPVWRFVSEDLWRAPVEGYADDSPVLRRVRIHEWGTSLARRLHKIDQGEAREVLAVTAMLLGFEAEQGRRL
jgi:hypothetical protein